MYILNYHLKLYFLIIVSRFDTNMQDYIFHIIYLIIFIIIVYQHLLKIMFHNTHSLNILLNNFYLCKSHTRARARARAHTHTHTHI